MKKMLMICLAGLAAAAFAAETAVEPKLNENIHVWAPKSYYLTPPTVTIEDGVAKIACGEVAEGVKPERYQFHFFSDRTYKAGVKYTFSFTIRSNMAVAKKVNMHAGFSLSKPPYTMFARTPIVLPAKKETTFKFSYTPEEDITEMTNAPTFQLPLKKGQTLEISNVKISEK